MSRANRWARLLVGIVAVAAAGCAGAQRAPATAAQPAAAAAASAEESPTAPADRAPADGASVVPAPETVSPAEDQAAREAKRQWREVGPCHELPQAGEKAIDATRRRLYRTVCGAALWFDGLFGEQRHVAAAQRASGRVELSFTESQFHGFKNRARANVRVKLPNLEERLEAFIGRDDDDQFVRDRNEGFALRSQFTDLEKDDRWVAGLGYGLPGSYAKRTDFRVGGRGGRTPEIFAQGRHRRNWFVGERSLWHFRETAFWTNRDGFGTTTALDFDHVIAPTLLLRLGSIGTFSEVTDGVDYRLVAVLYQNLSAHGRALAYELFTRGETDEEIRLGEYGMRTVFRRPIRGREWLFGELVAGYSWIRESRAEARQGSYLIGFGVELLYGRSTP